jgi:hypothetical protein
MADGGGSVTARSIRANPTVMEICYIVTKEWNCSEQASNEFAKAGVPTLPAGLSLSKE